MRKRDAAKQAHAFFSSKPTVDGVGGDLTDDAHYEIFNDISSNLKARANDLYPEGGRERKEFMRMYHPDKRPNLVIYNGEQVNLNNVYRPV